MKLYKRHLLLLVFLAVSIPALAQENTQLRPSEEWIIRAEEVFGQQFYDVAALDARKYITSQLTSGIPATWQQDVRSAQLIRTVARLKDGNEDSAVALMQQTTDAALRDRLALGIARHYFLKGDMAKAIPYYQQSGINNLTNKEIADAKFELAYSLFNVHQFDAAEPLLAIIREVPGKYFSAGNYYYGLLAYNRGKYEDALRSFERISSEPTYRSTVPYYIAELQYYMGNRKKALAEALRLIEQPEKLYYDNELHLLAAQCLFELDRYGDALPYFEYYYDHSDKIRKEELYEMGYSYYRVSEWKHAIEKFRPLSTQQDSLGQTAMYLLGDCYLKTGDKASARSAFGICANMHFNEGQREAALLLYGQLSQTLGFTDDALRSITVLLREYPDTRYKDQAFAVLTNVYASTANYAAAYASLAKMAHRPPEYGQLLQRVAYGYGIQQLQNRNTASADSLLDISLSQGASPYSAASAFWKSEIAGRQHRPLEAIKYAQQYLSDAKGGMTMATEATPAHAYLIMGYASMDAHDYGAAQQYFRKASEAETPGGDASLREADAYFMQKNFAAAAPLYARAANGSGGDYAKLQQAIILGVKGKREEKIRMLQEILNTAPSSQYAGDARLELAAARMEGGEYAVAVETLLPLTNGTKYAVLAPKAWVKIGTAYQQLNEKEKAEKAYIEILKGYPSSQERADAVSALKSLYIERNNPEGYAALLKQYNLESTGDADLEAAFYSAAEGQYAAQNWKGAQAAFEKYLAQFSNSARADKAEYYLGESLYQQRLYSQALTHYKIVLGREWNDFSENSALRASSILYSDKNWDATANIYKQLRAHSTDSAIELQALTGLMRTAAELGATQGDSLQITQSAGQTLLAGSYADTVLMQANISNALKEEAHLYQARALWMKENYAAADEIFVPLQLSKTTAIATEARYYHAAALMTAGKLKEAEDAAGKNIKKGGGSDYWVVKSYILLGDILTAEKDYFNARATLQSVVDHATVEVLKAEAQRKLDTLPKAETSKLSND